MLLSMEEPLTYNIDHALSLRFRTPVLTISRPQSADPSLLSSLMEDEQAWQKREAKVERLNKNIHYPYFRLRPLHSYELLQKLSLTQKLQLKGTRVVSDFFSRLNLEYLIEPHEKTYLVHALLGNKALNEYDLILQGSPHIAISGSNIRFTDPNVAWQDLAPFLDGPKSMSKQEYLQFKKDTAPEALIELESEAIEDEPTTQKILQLTDATCSFAKLTNITASHEQELAKAGFSKKNLGPSNFYCPTDKSLDAVAGLIKEGWKVIDSAGSELISITNSNVIVTTAYQVDGTVLFGPKKANLVDVANCAQQNGRFIPLGDGKSGLLCFSEHKELKELLTQVELLPSGLKLAKANIACLAPLAQRNSLECTDTTLGDRLRACFDSSQLAQRLPSNEFSGTLRPYQQEGLNWLTALYESGLNGLLADEMGLGKTVQVLAFLSHTPATTLIVVPTSLLYNWKREIDHFLPHKSQLVYHGAERNPQKLDTCDIIITSYGTLRSDIAHFTKHAFECIILDEAQAIKNSTTLTSQSVLQLNGRFRLSLTGTPVENSLSELICHYNFLEPGLLKNALETPLSLLRKKIAPFLLRRKKCDVARDLPEKIDEVVFVTMTDEQQLLYDRFIGHLKAGLLKKVALDGQKAHRMEIFEALLRLRQIACHPSLMPQAIQALVPEATTSAKFDLVLQDLETLIAEGKKILLFSQFTTILHLFAKEAEKRGWPHLLLEGQTSNRQALVDTFQNDPNYPLFLISLKAGGVGLNLTAADYVLLYDPWWNKAQEAQAIDRAHRIGRKETVFSKRYYVQGSIEEKILALQEKKAELAEALFEENGATNLTLDDLQSLID